MNYVDPTGFSIEDTELFLSADDYNNQVAYSATDLYDDVSFDFPGLTLWESYLLQDFYENCSVSDIPETDPGIQLDCADAAMYLYSEVMEGATGESAEDIRDKFTKANGSDPANGWTDVAAEDLVGETKSNADYLNMSGALGNYDTSTDDTRFNSPNVEVGMQGFYSKAEGADGNYTGHVISVTGVERDSAGNVISITAIEGRLGENAGEITIHSQEQLYGNKSVLIFEGWGFLNP